MMVFLEVDAWESMLEIVRCAVEIIFKRFGIHVDDDAGVRPEIIKIKFVQIFEIL